LSDEKINIKTALEEELRNELKSAYKKIEQLESEISELKKRFNLKEESKESKPPTGAVKIVSGKPIQSFSKSQPSIQIIQAKIFPDDVKKYAAAIAEKNSKGGLFGKGKVIERPEGWELFYYPYFDVEIEATVKETEKRGWFKKEQVTKNVKSRTGVDGLTGTIIDVGSNGISYKYAFLRNLDMDEVIFLSWIGSSKVTIKDLRGLGHSDSKSRRIADGLASQGIITRQNTRPAQYQSRYPYPYDPAKFISLIERFHPVKSSITERKIVPKLQERDMPSLLERYWNRCRVISSQIVYFPYYGVVFDRDSHSRFEIIDAITGSRQEYVEKFVNVEVKEKIDS